MIYSDLLRQILLAATALTFLGFALWALVRPNSLARVLGYELRSADGQSEFHAIYIGVFLGQFALSVLAAYRIADVVLGDLVAAFLLAQPLGRLIALIRFGAPSGVLRLLFALEAVGGVALLLVRPTG